MVFVWVVFGEHPEHDEDTSNRPGEAKPRFCDLVVGACEGLVDLWAVDIVKRRHLTDRCPVLFSPAFGSQDLRLMAEWILEDRLQVRFQMQLHKIIWDPETRGV